MSKTHVQYELMIYFFPTLWFTGVRALLTCPAGSGLVWHRPGIVCLQHRRVRKPGNVLHKIGAKGRWRELWLVASWIIVYLIEVEHGGKDLCRWTSWWWWRVVGAYEMENCNDLIKWKLITFNMCWVLWFSFDGFKKRVD